MEIPLISTGQKGSGDNSVPWGEWGPPRRLTWEEILEDLIYLGARDQYSKISAFHAIEIPNAVLGACGEFIG